MGQGLRLRYAGDPWSKPWGSARGQWYGTIYPRIQGFLPAAAILEIAPGFGRWTEFLLEYCETLVGVDVSPKCIEACQERFADRSGARFEVNDGHSLPMVEDSSIDFAFSFDSLVHVEAETLAGYLSELARVLKPDGVRSSTTRISVPTNVDVCAGTIARLLRSTAALGPGRSLTVRDLPG